jgi:hypothetical protein
MNQETSKTKWYEAPLMFVLEFVWEALSRAAGAAIGFLIRLF